MGALEETAAGRPGRATLTLVMRVGARAVRGFPPPEGFDRWTEDAVADKVGAIIEKKPHLLTKCAVSAVDEQAFERLLFTAIQRALIDEAKGTDVGKMRRRLNTLLGQDDRFRSFTGAGDAWGLVEHGDLLWQGDLAILHAAAGRVRGVVIEKLNASGPTPGPVRDSLMTVVVAVLREAGGAVRAQDLARVVFERFFPADPPSVSLRTAESEPIPERQPGPESLAVVSGVARALLGQLDQRERAILPHLGKSQEEGSGVLEGEGPAATAAIVLAVTEKVRRATANDHDGEAVVLELLRLCSDGP